MQILIPFLVCLIGLVIYLASNGKMAPIGKDMFWTGLLITLYAVSGHVVELLK